MSDDLGDLVGGDRLYSPVEMAFIVGYKPDTIQLMCRQGQVKAYKMGTMWRIKKSEISRFILEGPKKIGHFDNSKPEAEATS